MPVHCVHVYFCAIVMNCLFVCLSICLSVCLSVCLPVCLSVCPFSSVIILRLASSDENRIAASFSQFITEVNRSCVTSLIQLIDMADQQLKTSRTGTLRSNMIHDHLCRKVSLFTLFMSCFHTCIHVQILTCTCT